MYLDVQLILFHHAQAHNIFILLLHTDIYAPKLAICNYNTVIYADNFTFTDN